MRSLAPSPLCTLAVCAALAATVSACSGDDTSGAPASDSGTAADATSADGASSDAPSAETSAPATDAGTASATFASDPIDFAEAGCGANAVTRSLVITGGGTAPLAVSAATTGSGFSVTPSSLTISDGGTGTLTVSAAVPTSAAAGAPITGSLNLFTNDPSSPEVSIPLSVFPTGATLALPLGSPTEITFPVSPVGVWAPPVQVSLVNLGNAPATFSVGAPSASAFSLSAADAGGAYTLDPGATFTTTADFFPTSTAQVTATAAITGAGVFCGSGVSSLTFAAAGVVGNVTGVPTVPVDFGPATCGGSAPLPQSFTLTNTGLVTVTVKSVTFAGAPGFTTNIIPGRSMSPSGGMMIVKVMAPPVPTSSSLAPITGTLSIQTDASPSPITVALTEEPFGAVLSFDTSPTPSFGSFGSVPLLAATSQLFNVKNTGTAPAVVTLTASSPAAPDGGAPGDGGVAAPFSVSNPSVTVGGGASQSDAVIFSPTFANGATASLSMATASPLCGALPSPVPLSGVGLGGGPSVTPTSLTFAATCGGPSPQAQSILVTNAGTENLTWTLSSLSGPGASSYAVSAVPQPGLLGPGASATVLVRAAAVPSPAPNPDPQALAAQVTISTDVPFDPPHVISLNETPVGDQLAFAVPNLRFGQTPIGMSLSQTFTVTNLANPGSPPASFSLALQGAGATSYGVVPATAGNVAPAGGVFGPVRASFAPTAAVPYPATIAISTSDPLCTPLPAPLPVSGTGTQGQLLVSASSLTFGSDANDPNGMVDCGSTGLAHTISLNNVGNQALTLTGLTLGKGTSSPYAVSGATLPAVLPINGGVQLTVTPKAIPNDVADPSDATAFADTLTITSDAAGDTPHVISLVMQARGAIIVDSPLTTSWAFGTVGFGSIGTITTTIRNSGNAPAQIAFTGLSQPAVFGLRNDPTTLAPDDVTAIVGDFAPPSANGSWTDQGTLIVTGEAFCAPLPATWNSPKVSVSGTSTGSPPVAITGSLVFPATNCGAGVPAAQSVTLTNATNAPYPYTVTLHSGAFYTIANAGPGTLPASGTVTVVVAPKPVTPGPGVRPGHDAYEDDLTVALAAPLGSFVVPISWTLNGAVLALPQGAGPRLDAQGNGFYPADGASGFQLSMQNTGTATASVSFVAQPSAAFAVTPAGAIQVIPGIPATPGLSAGATAATCPATTPGTLTFVYAGPVCQPFALPAVNVQACAGTFP